MGADCFNGTSTQLNGFRTTTGATYPLLLCGACGTGDEILWSPTVYGDRDNWVVINKQGVIRYHAYDFYSYGNRYHLDELRGTIDSLVSSPVNVDEGLAPRAYMLDAAPNPFREQTTLEFTNPSATEAPARVTVHDIAGRLVASLWDAPAPRGRTTVSWDGRSNSGAAMGPGIYVVRAEVGRVRLTRRLVHIR